MQIFAEHNTIQQLPNSAFQFLDWVFFSITYVFYSNLTQFNSSVKDFNKKEIHPNLGYVN